MVAARFGVSWEVGAGDVGSCLLGTTACVLQAHPTAQLLQDNTKGSVRVGVLGWGALAQARVRALS